MSRFSQRHGRSHNDRELARRLEEHVHFTSLEARAYVDHRLAAMERREGVSREDLERSSLLAAQEAKAYADEAATSLARSLRGVATVALQASRRSGEVGPPNGPKELGEALPKRLARLSCALRETAAEGTARTGNQAAIEELSGTVERLSKGLEEVLATVHDIERIIAALARDIAEREDATGGREP